MASLRRIFFRALVVGLGQFVLALVFVPHTSPFASAAAESVGYPVIALFLGVPAALVTFVEVLLERRPRGVRRTAAVLAGASAAALLGVGVAWVQALYSSAVIERGALPAGIESLGSHLSVVGSRGDLTWLLGLFLLGFVLPFPFAALASVERWRPRTRTIVALAVFFIVVLSEDGIRAYWGPSFVQNATGLAAFALFFLNGVADRLARRGQPAETNAR
jgi:hypothetical protein